MYSTNRVYILVQVTKKCPARFMSRSQWPMKSFDGLIDTHVWWQGWNVERIVFNNLSTKLNIKTRKRTMDLDLKKYVE